MEKMQISRLDFSNAINKIKSAISSKEGDGIVPQSTHVAFLNDCLFACNDNLMVCHPFASGLTIAVPAAKLMQFVEKIAETTLSMQVKDDYLVLRCRKATAKLRLAEEIELPIDQRVSVEAYEWQLLPDNFLDAIAKCGPEAEKNPAGQKFDCLHIVGNRLETTSNERCTIFTLSSGNFPELLVQAKSLIPLLGFDPVRYAVDESWIHFINEENAVYSARIMADATYHELDEVIAFDGEELLFPKELAKDIESAGLFVDDPLHPDIDVSICQDTVYISAECQDGEITLEHTLPCSAQGNIAFRINNKFLAAAIDGQKPAVIGDIAVKFLGEDFVCVIVRRDS